MKNVLITLISVLVVLAPSHLKSQIKLSSNIVSKHYDISSYTKLDISDDFKVHITQTDGEESIDLSVNENLQDYVIVEKRGETLKIGLKSFYNIRGRIVLDMHIKTQLPIDEYRIKSDAEVVLETPLKAETLLIRASSDATFFGEVAVDNLEVQASSDAEIELDGKVNNAIVSLTSDAVLEAKNLKVDNLKIRLSSDAIADVLVNKKLQVTASSDAVLRYRGEPNIINARTSSDAEIIKF